MWCMLALLAIVATPVMGQDYRGLALGTEYPSITAATGETITVKLSVHNYGLAPQRVDLRLLRGPRDWQSVFVGGGRLVEAVFVTPDTNKDLELWLEPPKGVKPGRYEFLLQAEGPGGRSNLPLTVRLGDVLPRRLKLQPELPSLKGAPDADFTFRLSLENTSSQDALINLEAQAPQGFQVSFKEAYGSRQFASLPVEAGGSQKIDVQVKPPQGVAAGTYPVSVQALTAGAQAEAGLSLEVTGRPEITLSGPDGRLSGSATAGREKRFGLVVENRGSASARGVEFSTYEPTDWTVRFEPERLDLLPPGEKQEIAALVTPSSRAIAGDYMVTLRANAEGASDSQDFRITVRTSTLWGIVAVLIIAAALLVVVLAVMRYGRR